MVNNLSVSIAKIFPKSFRHHIAHEIKYAGFYQHPDTWITRVFVSDILFATVVTYFTYWLLPFFNEYPFVEFMVLLAIGFSLPYSVLVLLSDKRTTEMETSFPDALRLIASNIRAGFTPERALWNSIRPEFGILAEELHKAAVSTMAGASLVDALRLLASRTKSRMIKRNLALIIEGMQSGGELSELLDRTSEDLREKAILFGEMQSMLRMYVLFIMFATIVGAPLLYAASGFFVELNSRMAGLIGPEISQAAAVTGGPISISVGGFYIPSQELDFFMSVNILITSIGASLVIGELNYGRGIRGLRYLPIFSTAGLVIYFVVKFIVTTTFFGIMGF